MKCLPHSDSSFHPDPQRRRGRCCYGFESAENFTELQKKLDLCSRLDPDSNTKVGRDNTSCALPFSLKRAVQLQLGVSLLQDSFRGEGHRGGWRLHLDAVGALPRAQHQATDPLVDFPLRKPLSFFRPPPAFLGLKPTVSWVMDKPTLAIALPAKPGLSTPHQVGLGGWGCDNNISPFRESWMVNVCLSCQTPPPPLLGLAGVGEFDPSF